MANVVRRRGKLMTSNYHLDLLISKRTRAVAKLSITNP